VRAGNAVTQNVRATPSHFALNAAMIW